jgi:hypothetical protein
MPAFDLGRKVGRKIAATPHRRAVVLCVVDVADFDGSLPRAALGHRAARHVLLVTCRSVWSVCPTGIRCMIGTLVLLQHPFTSGRYAQPCQLLRSLGGFGGPVHHGASGGTGLVSFFPAPQAVDCCAQAPGTMRRRAVLQGSRGTWQAASGWCWPPTRRTCCRTTSPAPA